MDRLTKRISKTVQDKYSLGSYLYYDFANADDTNKLLNKLGQFEDFMETFGYESLQHLEFTLDEQNKIIEAYEKENQALKDRWQKLKEWFQNKDWDMPTSRDRALQKMQELEKEEI